MTPVDIDAWLGELGLRPDERADRDGITSWDLLLDGVRRHDIRVTLILDPALALLCWVHYAPPISDSFRVSYRKLLRWNDELPFIKGQRQRGRRSRGRRREGRRQQTTQGAHGQASVATRMALIVCMRFSA